MFILNINNNMEEVDEKYSELEKLCKTNDEKVKQLLDSNVKPSSICLEFACNVNSNSKNIVAIISHGIIPDIEHLLKVCNKKDNANAIIFIISNNHIIPDSKSVIKCYKYLKTFIIVMIKT